MEIIKKHKYFLFAVSLSFLTYVIFFGQFLSPSHFFWKEGNQTTDAQTKHIPARTYLYEKVVNEKSFPFWTEKMYSGFPIYADPENAYLHPINDVSVLIFGPLLSYKFLHMLEYLIGSLSLYFLLKRKGIGLWGYAAANAIFYFNTFFINHQVHFNMIMALYLLPTALLVADLFVEKRQLRYIFFQSLVLSNAVLWGHMQSAVIIGMGIFLYMLVFSFKKMRFATFTFYLIAVVFLVVIETLPQIAPAYELLSQSSREGGTDYLKGSLSPRMAIFSFVPYLFGDYKNFIGQEINDGFGYGEVYTYLGISSMLLSILTLIFLKKSREVVLAYIFIWVFLLFGFMESNKLFPDNTPIITLFRVWARTAVLSSFGVALLAGMLIEKLSEVSLKNARKGILFALPPLVYIWILIKIDDGKTAKKISSYFSYDYIQAYPYFPVLKTIVLVLAGVLLLFFILKKYHPKFFPKILIPIKAIILVVVFFDLIYFSGDVLAARLQDISGHKLASVPEEFNSKRVILNSLYVAGMESLYYDNWSPFGSSQLKSKDYIGYCGERGIKLRGVSFSNDPLLPENYQEAKEVGISAILTADGISYLNNNELDLIKNNLDGHYVEKKEGRVVMRINASEDTVVNTYLKYNPNWKVKIDGRETEIIKNNIFFDFPLSKGEHLVEIQYYPKVFYTTLAISLILWIAFGALYYFFGKSIEKKFLNNK